MLISNQAIRDSSRLVSSSLKEVGGNLLGGYAWATAFHIHRWDMMHKKNIFQNPLYAAQVLGLGNLFNIACYGAGIGIEKSTDKLFPLQESSMQKLINLGEKHPLYALFGAGIAGIAGLNFAKRVLTKKKCEKRD